MARKRAERAELVRDYLQRFPDTPTRTLARKVYQDNPEWFMSEKACYSSVRYFRGARGKGSRKAAANRDQFRELQNPAENNMYEMPPSQAEGWVPYNIDGPARVAILADIHIPYHDETALQAAVSHIRRKHDPTHIVLLGDVLDFYTLSRYLRDPRKRQLRNEVDLTIQFLNWLQEQFPEAKVVFKAGNHEERWDHFVWRKAPELWDLEQLRLNEVLGLKDLDIDWISDKRPIMCGQLPLLHGHELPRGMTNPVNMARGAFLRTIHTVWVAHGHRTSTHAEPDMFKAEIATFSQGCLCGLWPEYAKCNKWNHGFGYVDIGINGMFDATNYRITIDGEVRTS